MSGVVEVKPRSVYEKPAVGSSPPKRSEEHTSELQSQSNLVCRLLLEKKTHLRQPHRRPAADAGGGLPPHRGPDRQDDRVRPRRECDRSGEAVLPLLRPGRLPRSAPRL